MRIGCRAIALDVHPIVLPQLRSIVLLPHSLTLQVGTGQRDRRLLGGPFRESFEAWRKERKPSGPSKRVFDLAILWDPAIGPVMGTRGHAWALMAATTSNLLHLQCRSSIFLPAVYGSLWKGMKGASPRVFVNDEKPLTAAFGRGATLRRSGNQGPANACGHRRDQPKLFN